VNSISGLHFISNYHLKSAVNKQWILWTYLIKYTSALTVLFFPTGCAYMVTGHM